MPTTDATIDLARSLLVIRNPDGSTEGADPRKLGRAALEAAGYAKLPLLKVIRLKCLDCCCGQVTEVARCTAIGCALWPYRMATDPFTNRRGRVGFAASHKNLPALQGAPAAADPSGGDGGGQQERQGVRP
jgi:hypothetical protein